MLEKDKNCIEFSMRSMMLTHKPYQEDTDIAITGMVPGHNIITKDSPFDIPCDVIMGPKKDFERLLKENEKLQTENEQLKKKLEESLSILGYREVLTAFYPEADVEKFVQIAEQTFSQDRWKFWKDNYEALDKLLGFTSIEEIQDYLTNEAKCDTLHEAILNLKDQVKYTCDEWYSANSRNNSWKAAAECNSPKELIEKLSLLRDDISGRSTVIEYCKREIEKWMTATGCIQPEDISTESLTYKCKALDQEVNILDGALKEWKEVTGCPSPSAAKTLIESGASWHHAYNESKKANEKLADTIQSWQNVTGYSTPEDYMHARINNATPFDYTAAWQKATGFSTPKRCDDYIKKLEDKLNRINKISEDDFT